MLKITIPAGEKILMYKHPNRDTLSDILNDLQKMM